MAAVRAVEVTTRSAAARFVVVVLFSVVLPPSPSRVCIYIGFPARYPPTRGKDESNDSWTRERETQGD